MEDLVMGASLKETFAGKRVLVTGHTGFKGSWLAFWLTEMGADVTGFALAPDYPRSHFARLGLADRIHHVEGDLRDAEPFQRTYDAARPEFVFHLAAQALVRRSYADPKSTFDTNVGGSVNVLDAVRRAGGGATLIFVTSDKCYLNKEWTWGYRENDELGGHDPYSASKAAAEMAFMAYLNSYFPGDGSGPAAASVRAGNVIGGGDWAEDRIMPDCIRALEAGEPIKLRNPDATRPWQHVLDPLNGYLRLAQSLNEDPGRFQGSWNFGPELTAARTVQEVAETAVSIWGSGSVEIDRPNDAPFEHRLLQLSIDKAKLELGWRPRWNAEEAVEASVRWYKRVLGGEDAADVTREQIAAFAEAGDD